MRRGHFQRSHASMKPLNQLIKCKSQVREQFTTQFSCNGFVLSVKRQSSQGQTLQVHNQLMNLDFVGVHASWCLPSFNNVWIPRCSEALWQTNRSFRGVSELEPNPCEMCRQGHKGLQLQVPMRWTLCWHDSAEQMRKRVHPDTSLSLHAHFSEAGKFD